MSKQENTIGKMSGNYEGSGTWYDSTGKSMNYSVVQANRASGDGFEMEFKHNFDDGTATDAHFAMKWIAPFIFRLESFDKPIGNGYCINEYCHYHMKIGETFVEAAYRTTADGLEVFGSSTRNAEGNYIAWHENLRRKEF